MRYRITIRGQRGVSLELRGYYDASTVSELENFAGDWAGYGPVIASPAADDYDPFKAEGTHVGYDGYIPGPLDEIVQKRIAGEIDHEEMMAVIAAYTKDQNLRELHHFETEQENIRLRAELADRA